MRTEITDFATLRNDIQSALDQEDLAEALTLINEGLKNFPGNAALHTILGNLTQLTDFENPIEKAEEVYLEAQVLSVPNYNPGVELGQLKLNVYDDAQSALPYFTTAREDLSVELLEAIQGEIACLKELGRMEEANELATLYKPVFPYESWD